MQRIAQIVLSMALACVPMVVQSSSLLIIDSAQENEYRLQAFIELAKSVGFEAHYEPIASVIDNKITEDTLQNYDAIFFIVCPQLLAAFNKSTIALRFRSLIEHSYSLPHTLIGIAVPPFVNNKSYAQHCFELCGLLSPHVPKDYIELCEKFISVPLEKRKIPYHTSLLPPQLNRTSFECETTTDAIACFPLDKSSHALLEPLLPLGVYYYDEQKKNHHYLTSEVLLTGLGVQEECKFVPWEPEKRKDLFLLVQQSLLDLHEAYTQKEQKKVELSSRTYAKPVLPPYVEKLCSASIKGKKSKTAWFDLELFFDESKQAQQEQLVEAVLQARLTYLWLSISPNVYYSSRARSPEKKEQALQSLSRFTELLQRQFKELKLPIPKLVLGFEIANNLYEPNFPKKPATDLYGLTYNDVPNPLDRSFWDEEVVLPLKKFMADYSNEKISHGIPMSGVMIDLEMYGRKTTGSFLSTMVDDSIESKSFEHYFEKSKKAAQNVGTYLREEICNEIPQALIGCYAPSFDTSWFYQGLYKGLTPPYAPLFMCTFNSSSALHKQWFKKQGVPMNHASVVMFSKLTSKKDLEAIKKIKASHDGVWYNRFSRIVDPYEKEAWHVLEQTPLSESERKVLISEIAK